MTVVALLIDNVSKTSNLAKSNKKVIKGSSLSFLEKGKIEGLRLNGVQTLQPGQALDVYLDPAHIYIFAADGSLVSAAQYAEAA